jgi:LysR family transcriptional regulator for bpeEF and oprC
MSAMQDLRALSIFVRVAERRSFVRAAQELGITQSGVSNAIARLEDQLGVRLLARTTRRVNVTEDGAAFLDRCRQILSDLEEAELTLKEARQKPTGRLRLDMPVAFGRLRVAPLLGRFQQRYPDVTLAVSFTDRYVDLVEEGIDVAIRFDPLDDSSLIARRLTDSRVRVVGAPAYFAKHGRPKTPDDLSRHNCLAYMYRESRLSRAWSFVRNGRDVSRMPSGSMSLTDGAALCELVCAGYGLAQLRDYFVEDHVASGVLQPVLESFAPPAHPVWLVYPQTRHLSPKVRAFVDFLIAEFRSATRRPARAQKSRSKRIE